MPKNVFTMKTPEEKLNRCLNNYAYLTDEDKVVDLQDIVPFPIAFRHFLPCASNDRVYDITSGKKRAVKQAWKRHPERKTFASTWSRPDKPRFFEEAGKRYINSFCMPSFELKEDNERIKQFRVLFNNCVPDSNEQEWLLDWMAANVQHPEMRSQLTPIYCEQYDSLAYQFIEDVMEKLLGQCNITVCNDRCFTMKTVHRGYLVSSLMCCVRHRSVLGRLTHPKNFKMIEELTAKAMEVALNPRETRYQKVFTNFFFVTGPILPWGFKPEPRLFKSIHGPSEEEHRDFYNEEDAWVEQGVDALYHWLMSRDIANFAFITQ